MDVMRLLVVNILNMDIDGRFWISTCMTGVWSWIGYPRNLDDTYVCNKRHNML
jgi:hypothetical protein